MKKKLRILSIVAICVLGYMVATDAVGRWFGLWGYRYVFNFACLCLLPGLVYLSVDDSKIKS